MSLKDDIERARKMLDTSVSPTSKMGVFTRTRNRRANTTRLAKFIVSRFRMRVIGPNYKEIQDHTGFSYSTVRSYLSKTELNSVFEYANQYGVILKDTQAAIEYLKAITPAINVFTWSTEELDKLMGPRGLINSYFLSPQEVLEVLDEYGRRKFGIRTEKLKNSKNDW